MLGLVVLGQRPDRDLPHDKFQVIYLIHKARTELDFSVSGDGQSDPYVHSSKSTGLRVAVQNQFFTVDSILGTVLRLFFFHFTVTFLTTFERQWSSFFKWKIGALERLSNLLRINYYVAAAAAKSLQSCPTLCDPIDGLPPGSPIPGILQARTLEWVAVSFSNAWKWKWSRSVVSDF